MPLELAEFRCSGGGDAWRDPRPSYAVLRHHDRAPTSAVKVLVEVGARM